MALRNRAAAAAAIAGIWTGYNGLLYAADATKRYRIEAAWFLLSAILIVIAIDAIARGSQPAPRSQSSNPRKLIIGLAIFLIGAAALYFPILPIGLLSDDFTLLARAESGALADPAWEFLRPLPLLLWRILKAPIALHALNIVLHGLNAWLTAMVATRFGLRRIAALLAGLVFLAMPSSVEAVAWAAGVFDVLMVTLILGACVATTSMANGAKQFAAIAALTAAALATKETAVITPAILLIASLGASKNLKNAAWPVAISAGVVAAYLAIRIAAGFSSAPPSADMSGYMLKEVLSRPFATLGLPFHAELLKSHGWIPYVFALLWPLLFAMSASQWRSDRATAIRVLAGSTWILASVLPLATMLFIADDLQGSRYVYLGSAAFSIMLLALIANLDQTVQMLIVISLIALFAVATHSHQSAWIAAAHERDRVLAAFRDARIDCANGEVRGLPDHVQGAYVFRNGFNDAVRRITSSTPATCDLAWDGERFTVVR
jgi:hypothetical protein